MRMQRVASSVVAAIGYDSARRVLLVAFHGGRMYAYADVPRDVHREFVHAASIGTYLNELIKPRYRAVRVPASEARRLIGGR
jgi:hypothetical protein